MSQENSNNRVFVTGHTRGIGKAVCDLFTAKGYQCEGVSTSTGFDIVEDCDRIVDMMKDFDYIVLNAYKDNSQKNMLKKIIKRYQDDNKKVAVITSTSGTPIGEDPDHDTPTYKKYCQDKKNLMAYIEAIQQDLFSHPMNIYDVCPDTVKTDMSDGLWEDWPKLSAEDVAECVWLCFTSKFNFNRMVVQKHGA